MREEGRKAGDGMRVTVLGCRGSMPMPGPETAEFGGNSSCYRVEAAGETLYLDAGTGLAWENPAEGPVRILLSHCHLDHVLGLPMFPGICRPEGQVEIYGPADGGMGPAEQLARFISPPLWPLGLEGYPAEVRFPELKLPGEIGPFRISAMESNHPGRCLIYRVEAEGRSLVYATDFEHSEGKSRELAAFAEGADLILYDGQYTEEEYARRRGYGHSTPEAGLRLLAESGVRQLVLVHHDPWHSDAILRAWEEEKGVHFAREGETFRL